MDQVKMWRNRFLFKLLRLYWRLFKPVTLGARTLVVRDDSVLLVQLTYYPGWLLPGGGVERGETFEEAARRELLEESGLQARSLQLFGIYITKQEGKIDHVAVYGVEDFEGEARIVDSAEIKAVRFFNRLSLPPDVLPGHRRRIEEYFGTRDKVLTW